jgi:hypothetical protein
MIASTSAKGIERRATLIFFSIRHLPANVEFCAHNPMIFPVEGYP